VGKEDEASENEDESGEFSEESYEDIRMQQFYDMSEEEKESLKCDELFCLYLRHMSK
jgi:hypothetical protein